MELARESRLAIVSPRIPPKGQRIPDRDGRRKTNIGPAGP